MNDVEPSGESSRRRLAKARFKGNSDGGALELPEVQIILRLEAAPVVRHSCRTFEDDRRLEDWVRSNPPLSNLVRDALHLARKARAA